MYLVLLVADVASPGRELLGAIRVAGGHRLLVGMSLVLQENKMLLFNVSFEYIKL
jgi:hypothetical protein